MSSLAAKTILITGASGGVGRAIANRLVEKGATVCLSGRNRKRLAEVASELPEERTRCYLADLTIESQVQKAVKKLLRENKHLDAVIHCAAIIKMETVATAPAKDFAKQLQTNVIAPFRLTQLLLPALIASRGQIVFINSSAGRRARAKLSQYAATKHALKAVADSLRDECNEVGVRVCSIYLGSTATPMQAAVRAQEKRLYEPKRLIQPADVAAVVAGVLALPRTAEVTDLMMRPMEKA